MRSPLPSLPPVALASGLLALLSPLVACGPKVRVTAPTIPMADGVALAADLILPAEVPAGGVPVVLVQTRYWRSFQLKMRRPPGAMPIQPREPVAEALVEAGYGVVLVDVRGTGASEGVWPHPWSKAEVADMGSILDWAVAQPWSDGRLGAYGVSYEGSTALLAASQGRPALRAVLAREIEWDVLDEILAPGGVRIVSFVEAWGRSTAALDRGEYPELFPASAAWVVAGPRRVDADPEGLRLAERLAQRPVADVAAAVSALRAPADPLGLGGPPISSVGPSSAAAALQASPTAIGLWGGWWDGATGDAVLRADAAIGLVDARIGPWTHEGDAVVSPLGRGDPAEGRVELAQVVAFFDAHLRGEGAPPRRSWWEAGAERWETAAAWPSTTPTSLHLRGDGTLGAPDPAWSRALAVDFAATTGPSPRWMTGVLRPLTSPDRAEAPGLLSWTYTAPAAVSVFGAPTFSCDVGLAAPEAALHVYLEAEDDRGRVRLITEGVARVTAGPVTVPLRAVALRREAGEVLRLSIAGADAGTFERVPASGPQTITLSGAGCALTLPVR